MITLIICAWSEHNSIVFIFFTHMSSLSSITFKLDMRMYWLMVTSPPHARGNSTKLYAGNQTTSPCIRICICLCIQATKHHLLLAWLVWSRQPNTPLLHTHSLATGSLALRCKPGPLEKTTKHTHNGLAGAKCMNFHPKIFTSPLNTCMKH